MYLKQMDSERLKLEKDKGKWRHKKGGIVIDQRVKGFGVSQCITSIFRGYISFAPHFSDGWRFRLVAAQIFPEMPNRL